MFGLIDNILSGKGEAFRFCGLLANVEPLVSGGVMGGGGGGPGSSDGFSRGDGERAKGFGGGLNLTDIRGKSEVKTI